jgi:hypothetical protein
LNQQGEDLMGKDFLDNLVMETTDPVEGAIRGCTSFGNQYMDMRMEVDAITESLDHGHYSRHKLKARGCVQEFYKCTHRRETEIIEELSLKAEKQPKHFWKGEDNLTVRNIIQKFLPHPLAPLLTAPGMTGRTESACLAGKHQQALFPIVGAPDAGKSAHRIAAVEIFLNDILNHRTEIPVLLLEGIAQNNEKTPDKKQCVPDDVGDRSLPWQGG